MPLVARKDAILVFYYRLSKMIHFVAMLGMVHTRRWKSIGLAQKYIEYVNFMKRA